MKRFTTRREGGQEDRVLPSRVPQSESTFWEASIPQAEHLSPQMVYPFVLALKSGCFLFGCSGCGPRTWLLICHVFLVWHRNGLWNLLMLVVSTPLPYGASELFSRVLPMGVHVAWSFSFLGNHKGSFDTYRYQGIGNGENRDTYVPHSPESSLRNKQRNQ